MRPWQRVSPLLALLLLGGCAYYNGIYNAKAEARAGDRAARAGRDNEARGRYALSAQKAETVLVRFPRSRWRPDALLLAGRGNALSHDCLVARERLEEFLALPARSRQERERATIARAGCDVRDARSSIALADVEPLVAGGATTEIRREAAVVAARAAVALGDPVRARGFLGRIDASGAQWELAAASLAVGELATAESLLTLRAARGDWRPEFDAALRELWSVGAPAAAERLANRLGASKARPADRISAHSTIAELAMSARRDSTARVQLMAIRRLAIDTLVDAEASVRLTLLDVGRLARLEDVAALIRRSAVNNRGTLLQRQLEDNLLLVQLFESRQDLSGASLFLAAEVARDSLRADPLAAALFQRVEERLSGSLLAPRALLAASAMLPDSAPVFAARMRERYPRSPYTAMLDGANGAALPAHAAAEQSLRTAWQTVVGVHVDSVNQLRGPKGGARIVSPGQRP